MSERDLVAVGIDAMVPLRLERAPAWDDVLARAGLGPSVTNLPSAATRRRRVRRLVLALTIAVVTLAIASAVAAAFGQDVFGGLSSWLDGAPGEPAPPAQQNAFAQRNGASYASFPTHTRLRLLDTQHVRGQSFALLGFRDGGSLCLRLVPTHAPALGGVNQCVTLRELRRSPVPAVVASTAYYPIAGGRVAAVFGFADDTVHSVRVTHATGGAQTVRAINNIFLALHAGPSDPIYDPVVQVSATLRTGASIVLPFTTLGAPVQSQVPSYLRYEAVRLPGPTRQEATLPRTEIGWLDRRERRGGPFVPSLRAYGPTSRQVVFARSVQPDPYDAYRIGLAVLRVRQVSRPFDFTWVKRSADARPHRVRLRPGMLLLCSDELFPLRRAPTFNNCVLHARSSGLFPAGHVLTVDRMYREAFTRVSGLAADGVSEIELYLASGRVIPAGLHDNAYTVEAPSAQWPAKLVALDRHGRPLGVYSIDSQKSRAVIAPCPPAVLPAGPAAATPPYERLDLLTGTVDGHVVLGRTAASIASALGKPNAYRGQDLLYGPVSKGNAALTIHLAPSGPAARAVWLEVTDARATGRRLGRVLAMQPIVLQQRIAAAYPALEHAAPYGSAPALLGCTGTFRSRRRPLEVAFGLDPSRPARTFVRISDTHPAGSKTAAPATSSTIAFSEGTERTGFRIALASPNGVVRVTHLASASQVPLAPIWAPDGSQFLAVDDRGIFVVSATGSDTIRVSGVTSGYEDVAWSPDSRRIAFHDNNMLFVVNADGSGGLERLTRYADRGWAWAPDGKRIAYVGISAGGRRALFIVNTVGSPQPRRIDVSIPGGGPAPSYFTPTWSPDGTRLAFECCANGYQPDGNWIYLVSPSGSGLTRAYEGDIRGWSPDGRSFLVSRGFNALWKLFLVRSDGTFVARVPACSSGCGYVAWSPDSKSIIYNEQRRIYVARVDGSMRRAVVTSHRAFPQLSVSADGSTIAYVDESPRGRARRLSIVRIDGSHRRVVVESSTVGFWNPAWRPRPR